ncbi:MAG: hypothetical protein ACRDD1_00450, partial [Planctomycetia bacterium]
MTPSPTVNESPPKPATLDDLMRYEGKAELIAGRIVPLSPTGHSPHVIALRITIKLSEYAARVKSGVAYADNVGVAV